MTTSLRHVDLMGLELAALTEEATVVHVLDALGEKRGGWVCPVNLDVLRQVASSGELRELVASADLAVADGMPLLWASRLQRTPLPERIAGSSLVVSLSGELASHGRSVYLLGGGNPETSAVAAERLRDAHPALRVAGTCCPPFGFERSPQEQGRIVSDLTAAAPDVVFVGLGFPKQDRLIAELRGELPHAWFVSCGATFSFLAGEVRRAPPLFQRMGLEWVHRLAQEPTRLARRYLVQGLPFAARLAAISGRRRFAVSAPGPRLDA